MTSLATLPSLSNSNYNYEYYPNINLCNFNPGSSETKTIDYATSWSSSSFTKVSGWTNTYSMGIYRLTWSSSSHTFSEGSYMKVTIDSEFSFPYEYCKEISGFLPGSTLDTSNLICRQNANNEIMIAGYSSISAGTSLSITMYLQVNYGSLTTRYPNARIIVYSADNNKIIDAQTNSYTLTISEYGSNLFSLDDHMEKYISKGNSQELDIVFRLASHTLTSGSYIALDLDQWTVDPAATEGKMIWKYQVGNNIYWVPTEVTNPSGNVFHIPVYSNYSMTHGQDIKIRIYHLLPDQHDGVYFPADQWNHPKIYAYNSANTILEHQYAHVWVEPYHHTSLTVNPILNYVSAVTLYEFAFTPNVSASAGDRIALEFRTTDALEDMFTDDLGSTIATNSSFELSCHEIDHASVISDSRIKCELFAGDKSANPPIPTTILIPITKSIAANTEIKFNILNLKNPAKASYYIAVTAKLMNHCVESDHNNPCTYYKSTKYITFNNAPSIPNQHTTGSMGFNPNRVSATNA